MGMGRSFSSEQIFGSCVKGEMSVFLARFSEHLLRIHEILVVKRTGEGGF